MRPIHLAQLDKTRPVLLLTRAVAVGRLRTVTVAEITSRIHGLHTEVLVGPSNGLDGVVQSRPRRRINLGRFGHLRRSVLPPVRRRH